MTDRLSANGKLSGLFITIDVDSIDYRLDLVACPISCPT